MINPVTSGKLFGRPVATVPLSMQEQELIGAMDRARVQVVKLESELRQFFDRGPRLTENSFDANDLKDKIRGAREYLAGAKQRLADFRSNSIRPAQPGAVLQNTQDEVENTAIDVLFSSKSTGAKNPLTTAEFQRSLEQYDANGKVSVLGKGSLYVTGQYVDKVM